uniref:Uncharacterized protein n=1 Tax=Panagrolaimus superbus TaxID=310955 RepID=A0A914XXV6_9BILA
MKFLVLISLAVIFNNILALDLCSDADKAKITTCYNAHIFPILPNKDFRDNYLVAIRNETKFAEICVGQKHLDECLGGPLIQRCFNIEDLKNVTFVDNNFDARIFIGIYLQNVYGCQKVPQLFKDQRTCIFYQGNLCKKDMSNCSSINTFSKCAVERVTKHCGKPAGCILKKFTTLESCYVPEVCLGCDSLNVNNKAIDALCHDDLNSGIRYPANIVIVVVTTLLSYLFCSR